MSLLTDALRLREGRRPAKGGTRPSLPPFRGPNRGYWVGGILVSLVCLVVGLACWKGTWALGRLEELAGFPPMLAAKVSQEPKSLDLPKEAVSPPLLTEAVKIEATREGEAQENPVGAIHLAKGETFLRSESMNPPLVPLGEEKKKEEETVGKSAEKGAEGKVATKAVVMEEKKPVLAVEAERVVAKVPVGGLKPMKVELDEAGLVLEKPEERERKRVDIVETFLRSLQVQGVRLQGKNSRIMVDGVPIGLGEKVGAIGLVLESVEPQKLIFSDSGGKKYPKSY